VIAGIIFDLDGTLADSQLDFEAMRLEMELPPGQPILEALAHLPPARAARCREILHRHELAGAERARPLPGVAGLFLEIERRGWRTAIATRNSREITALTLAKLSVSVELAMTRDDGPVKPDPWAVRHVCQTWNVSPANVVVIGDYKFDIESGRAAGARTVLLTHPHDPRHYPNHEQADLLLLSLEEYPRLLAWLESL
jgi:HAD superfamily hydrolase (TIGR01509 family)